ncbi:hypothetical protein CBI38_33070 (plasmid) [Rhodococcus oxybenzonivorans]|uniref:Transposase IS116/IS110/IS902 C-terminal domain-containing protein n=1 Tax=Rhodococcus oxybenzonivorans TaxID=1990687 RepID=A0A2S2C5W5_9NOCA|nr:transposase [Rhodococcus oxybenzonivorans]AWK76291.1 hypothetical protein CBI38_33070 [Rhodococcus oxybenzonivorans]
MALEVVAAADQQSIALPGDTVSAQVVARLAKGVPAHTELTDLDDAETRFCDDQSAEIIMSMPGFGPKLGAEFLAATGGDINAFTSVGQLAGFADLAPQPRDSGRVNGKLRRPT